MPSPDAAASSGDDKLDDELPEPPKFKSALSRFAGVVLLAVIPLSALAYWGIENHKISYQDSFYFMVVTITTVGYGDFTPHSVGGQVFILCYIFFALTFAAACFGLLAVQVAGGKSLPDYFGVTRSVKHRVAECVVPLIMVVVNVLFLALLLHFNEDVDWITSFYWGMVTLSTVGYGDPHINKESTRMVTAFFLLWGVPSVAWSLQKIANITRELEEDKQLAHFIRLGVTPSLIKEMDNYGNGRVSRHSFLRHMLIKLHRARRSDMDEISHIFDMFDVDKSGTIDKLDIRNNNNRSAGSGATPEASA